MLLDKFYGKKAKEANFGGHSLSCFEVKLPANGQNIVGCYMLCPFPHPVACCWMLLRVVARNFKPVNFYPRENERNIVETWALVKLRIINHKLMIEIGRYYQTAKDNRHCPFCGCNVIEDEVHFLFQCPTYSMIRNKLYYKVKTLIPPISL